MFIFTAANKKLNFNLIEETKRMNKNKNVKKPEKIATKGKFQN